VEAYHRFSAEINANQEMRGYLSKLGDGPQGVEQLEEASSKSKKAPGLC